jgi:hypothetical protein
MMRIKEEVVSEVLSNKDIFLDHGIILEDFDFEISEYYKKLFREPFFSVEVSEFRLRIPLKGISKGVFEFTVYLNMGCEPNISYYLYQKPFFTKKLEISVSVPFSDPFIEENFKGNWGAFKKYASPILEKYFSKSEVEFLLDVVGGVTVEIEPYVKYKEIII